MSSAFRTPLAIRPPVAYRAPVGTKARAASWRVIHACEWARDVLPIVESQIAVSMRPYVVTPQGAGAAEVYLTGAEQAEPRPLSLLRCWQDVRNWRRSILECEPERSADLVHAHSFTSGMAAVRCCACVVYDLRDCIEDYAIAAGQCEAGSWMGRSFRAAEQFILSRAAAVIVHSLGMKKAAAELGASAEEIYLIPDPLPPEDEPALATATEVEARDSAPNAVTLLVPQLAAIAGEINTQEANLVLEAFAQAIRQVPVCRLVVEAPTGARPTLWRQAARLGVSERVFFRDATAMRGSWQIADIVVTFGPDPASVAARHPNPVGL
jgi:hypothetical protein